MYNERMKAGRKARKGEEGEKRKGGGGIEKREKKNREGRERYFYTLLSSPLLLLKAV